VERPNAPSLDRRAAGVLCSMSKANRFILREHERGSVNPGGLVQLQLPDGPI